MADRGVAKFDGRAWQTLDDGGGLAGPNVRRIVEDPDGTLWFCCDTWLRPGVSAGLSSRRHGTCRTYRAADGLPDDSVYGYFRDSSGRRFALTRSGLARWQDDRWRTPLAELGLAGHADRFWSIAETPSGGVLVLTGTAAFLLRDGSWQRIALGRADQTRAKTLSVADEGLVAVSAGRFQRWTGHGFEPTGVVLPSAGLPEFTAQAPDGSVWCVGHDLLSRWAASGDEWTRYRNLPPPRAVDREGRVWFVGGGRAVIRDEEGWRTIDGVGPTVSFDGRGHAWSWGTPSGCQRRSHPVAPLHA